MRREWIEILSHKYGEKEKKKSPSMRREWIEISTDAPIVFKGGVSLHAEGVD